MLATGEALERYAEGRAHRELTALLGRAPRDVHRYVDGRLETVADRRRRGGRPARWSGRARSCRSTGWSVGGPAVLDESALTGESRLVTRSEGDAVSSRRRSTPAAPFDLRAIATGRWRAPTPASSGSSRRPRPSKAPVRPPRRPLRAPLRPADAGDRRARLARLGRPGPRPSRSSSSRRPCPLLLAAPIAIVAGISRAARRGIIVKGGGPLETLARARVAPLRQDRDADGRPAAPARLADDARRRAGRASRTSRSRLGRARSSRPRPTSSAGAIVHAARERDLELALADRRRREGRARRRGDGGRDGASRSARRSSAPARPAARAGPATSAAGRRSRDRRTSSSRVDGGSSGRPRPGRPDPAGDAASDPSPAPGRVQPDRHGHRRPSRRRRDGRRRRSASTASSPNGPRPRRSMRSGTSAAMPRGRS